MQAGTACCARSSSIWQCDQAACTNPAEFASCLTHSGPSTDCILWSSYNTISPAACRFQYMPVIILRPGIMSQLSWKEEEDFVASIPRILLTRM